MKEGAMARPLRIEYPGAVYHITSRGNARGLIFDDNEDREGMSISCMTASAKSRPGKPFVTGSSWAVRRSSSRSRTK
jgi:hypothetical protein